jgi:hypothetical protein
VLHRAVRARQGHKPSQAQIPAGSSRQTAPHRRSPRPAATRTPQPHPGHPNRIPAAALDLTRSGQPGSPENACHHHGPDIGSIRPHRPRPRQLNPARPVAPAPASQGRDRRPATGVPVLRPAIGLGMLWLVSRRG